MNSDPLVIYFCLLNKSMKLSVLTWNIWDTPYFGSRKNSQRLDSFIDYLYMRVPEIIFIQESFDPSRRAVFLSNLETCALGYNVPKNASEERRILGLIPFFDATGGLITLSKYPITSSDFHAFETSGRSFDERFCGKGYTKTFVNTPNGEVLVVNTHLSNRPQDVEIRVAQLEQLLQELRDVEAPIFLGGDFNTTRFLDGTGEQTEEFEMIEDAGFADSLVGREEDFETFSHSNVYSHYPEHGRIDFVFYKEGKEVRINPRRSQMLGTDIPISDHYGYLAEFEVGREKV